MLKGTRTVPKGKIRPKGFWKDVENRKKFLQQFAVEAGFDPLDAASWQKVTETQIKEKKVKMKNTQKP